jgi:hypothetical protein
MIKKIIKIQDIKISHLGTFNSEEEKVRVAFVHKAGSKILT